MQAVLMNKDTVLLVCQIDHGIVQSVSRVEKDSLHLFPVAIATDPTPKAINKWIRNRKIPEGREGMETVMKMFPNAIPDGRMFSLQDHYWFAYSHEDSWEKYNYFTNSFSEEYGKAYFDYWNVDEKHVCDPSPDHYTGGKLRKRWTIKDGQTCLIKAASKKYMQEPLSEVLTTKMLNKMGLIPYVTYDLLIDGTHMCSICNNFLTEDTELVTAMDIYNQTIRPAGVSVYDHLITQCRNAGIPNAADYIEKMIFCDHIVYNNDRNLANFGFIRDVNTGEYLGFAPLFDFGASYWGESDNVNQTAISKAFEPIKKKVLIKAHEKGWYDRAQTTDEIENLIRIYPQITAKKKDAILKKIEEMNLAIEKGERATVFRNGVDERSIPDEEYEL